MKLPDPTTMVRLLGATFLVLLLLHGLHLFIFFRTGTHYALVDMNHEQNLPTVMESLFMLIAAVILGLIARHRPPHHRAWWFLAGLFVLVAADELLRLHERLTVPTRELLVSIGPERFGSWGPYLHFAWVLPYALVLLVLGVLLLRWFWALCPRYRWWFGTSAVVFVGGAMGMEILGGPRTLYFGRSDPLYALFTTAEESLEFTGLIIFISGLADYHRRCLSVGAEGRADSGDCMREVGSPPAVETPGP